MRVVAADPPHAADRLRVLPTETDEQRAQLDKTATKLKSLKPDYASCSFDASGSTLSYTPETVLAERVKPQAIPSDPAGCGKRWG